MELIYHKSRSSAYPELIDETSSKTTVYIRKNVEQFEEELPDGTKISGYEYDECKLSKAQYELYKIEQKAESNNTELQLAIAELAELILK